MKRRSFVTATSAASALGASGLRIFEPWAPLASVAGAAPATTPGAPAAPVNFREAFGYSFGTQYYRPPFPTQKYWADDLKRMKDVGLDTVQVWAPWAWLEPEPGKFVWDDYDKLVELAEKNGLLVVISVLPEINPMWIFNVCPGTEMVDHMGHRVISSTRVEVHHGLTPGGCTDYPQVWNRMKQFLTAIVKRYRGISHLRAWDIWNETRWNVQADGFVCYCPKTLEGFRKFLQKKYDGKLDALNTHWMRRYRAWNEVFPGKSIPSRPYTEMMAFQHYMTERSVGIARSRYEVVKGLDPKHQVVLHGARPSVSDRFAGNAQGVESLSLDRGNDWGFAKFIDGLGTSSFPKWFPLDPPTISALYSYLRSAVGKNKAAWQSEIQGARAVNGFSLFDPVDAASQQKWIWTAVGSGSEATIFWCWRDDSFGREAGGYGIVNNDGFAEERLAAVKKTSGLLREHRKLITDYAPDDAEAGVLWSPQSYYLYYAQLGQTTGIYGALHQYATALLRRGIPFRLCEEEHLGELAGLKVLYLPHTLVADTKQEDALEKFVADGGTLVCESECAAWTAAGIYRTPDERFLARAFGIAEAGRRGLKDTSLRVRVGKEDVTLGLNQWTTPLVRDASAKTLAEGPDGPLAIEKRVGKGRVFYFSSFLGAANHEKRTVGFDALVEHIALSSGVKREIEMVFPGGQQPLDAPLIKTGLSGGKRLVFAIFPDGMKTVQLRAPRGFFSGARVRELIDGRDVDVKRDGDLQSLTVPASVWGVAVVVG